MPEISVVIMTLNEERNIERCLHSVKEIADEIVVVDSFSTDRTEEICLRIWRQVHAGILSKDILSRRHYVNCTGII